jgi:predicted acetyltransferase
MPNELALTLPDTNYADEFLCYAQELSASGFDRYDLDLLRRDFPGFIHSLQAASLGENLPPGIVPQTTYWFVQDGWHILGEIRLRHHLTPALEEEGGNIGYLIRPSERRKGYGTLQLKLLLPIARQKGLTRVLVTCDTDNTGSALIIEHNGGLLASQGISTDSGKPISRYWIDLQDLP